MDKVKRINELVKILKKANQDYYNNNFSEISDKEYDSLYDELLNLEKDTGIVLKNSPTQKVGSEPSKSLQKKDHIIPMLSLNKTKSIDELKRFLGEQEGILSWKLDGLTVVIRYFEGKLIEALTRGNGLVGEVVTNNAKTFKNIPKTIEFKENLIIRGEAVINYTSFFNINNLKLIDEVKSEIMKFIYSKKLLKGYENIDNLDSNILSAKLSKIILTDPNKLFSEREDFDISELLYKNPRNLCSGAVRQLDSSITAKRDVKFYAFNLVEATNIDFKNSHQNELEFLKNQGFEVVEYERVNKENIEKIVAKFSNNVGKNPSPSDGLVLQFDDILYGESLGATSKFPQDSIAFKWADDTKNTKLVDVIWNTSRTGLINPIAVFEPVELEGTTVRRASLHNVAIFENLKLGIGDEISVYKANMIIPQIYENFTKSATLKFPTTCPTCGRDTIIKESGVTKELYCSNDLCPAKISKFLENFISKNGMDINGFGQAKLNIFIDNKFISNYVDIYRLKYKRHEIIEKLELEKPVLLRTDENKPHKMGIKMLDNILDGIDESRNTNLINVLASLNIKNLGKSVAKQLVIYFNNDIEKLINASEQTLSEIDGIGEIIAVEIVKYFKVDKNRIELYELLSELNINKIEVNKNEEIFGKTFVITGKLNMYKDRNELKYILEKNGAKVSGSISKNTDYLINNDINSTSSKNNKAKELGIKIINEEQVNSMLNYE